MIQLLQDIAGGGTPPIHTTTDKTITPEQIALIVLSAILLLIIISAACHIAYIIDKKRKQPKPTPQENVFFCYKCGKEIPKESEFCPHCGTKQGEQKK